MRAIILAPDLLCNSKLVTVKTLKALPMEIYRYCNLAVFNRRTQGNCHSREKLVLVAEFGTRESERAVQQRVRVREWAVSWSALWVCGWLANQQASGRGSREMTLSLTAPCRLAYWQ